MRRTESGALSAILFARARLSGKTWPRGTIRLSSP